MTLERELLETAIAGCRVGAEALRRSFRAGSLEVRSKGENDFVTLADRESEAAIVSEVRRRFPHHRILAEEGGGAEGGGGDCEWLIDPLDGTTNFLQGLPIWCISIACRRGGELLAAAVYDPPGDNLFTAVRGGGARWNGRPMRASSRPGLAGAFLATGFPFRAHRTLDLYLALFREVFLEAKAIRRCGSAALDLAYTAAGVYDGFFEFRLSPWDIGAGILLVREAGGLATDLDGGGRTFAGGNVVAGGAGVQPELLAAVRRLTSEAGIEAIDPRAAAPPLVPVPGG
ncbi:MAG TPA: inositol monophosphatase family protein [Thermoanaerobaculia bacterium]|nr:inositol monophosphatase family protein [Thermoanaerobaculia bacterium]